MIATETEPPEPGPAMPPRTRTPMPMFPSREAQAPQVPPRDITPTPEADNNQKCNRKKWIMRLASSTIGVPRLSEKLEDYEELETIGRGSYGEVFKVRDVKSGVCYAMKVLSKKRMTKENKLAYLKVESQALQRLSRCMNVVKLHKAFQDAENCYLIMDLAENGTLDDVLEKYVALKKESAVVILAQVLSAISYMHSCGVLHRDLKPANVLLDSRNVVRVTDFGTAKMFSDGTALVAPKGSFVGSPDYVAPEIISSEPVGPDCDLWSFGCIVYALFAGEAPFHTEAGSYYATFQRILSGRLEMLDFVPEDVKDLVQKLLQVNPEMRLGHGEWSKDQHECYSSIKNHKFFEGIDWHAIGKKSPPAFQSFEPAFERKQAIEKEKQRQQQERARRTSGETVIKEVNVTWMKPDGDVNVSLALTDKRRLLLGDMESETAETVIIELDVVLVSAENDVLTISAVDKEYVVRLANGGDWHDAMPELFSM